jgi:hypothetical protein
MIKALVFLQLLRGKTYLHRSEHDGDVDNSCQDPGEIPLYESRALVVVVVVPTNECCELSCLRTKPID